jgi:uncharacterized DUF497 family protein
VRFDWDEGKAKTNARKHGVSFDEATSVFRDPLAGTIPDPDHSTWEERWVTIGMSSSGRLLVVCHTEEGEVFRMISAREASTDERKRYEA